MFAHDGRETIDRLRVLHGHLWDEVQRRICVTHEDLVQVKSMVYEWRGVSALLQVRIAWYSGAENVGDGFGGVE